MGADLSGSHLGANTAKQDLDSIYRNLIATLKSIAENPKLVSSIEDPLAGMDVADLEVLRNQYPEVSFIFIYHTTKEDASRG